MSNPDMSGTEYNQSIHVTGLERAQEAYEIAPIYPNCRKSEMKNIAQSQ